MSAWYVRCMDIGSWWSLLIVYLESQIYWWFNIFGIQHAHWLPSIPFCNFGKTLRNSGVLLMKMPLLQRTPNKKTTSTNMSLHTLSNFPTTVTSYIAWKGNNYCICRSKYKVCLHARAPKRRAQGTW